MEQEPELEGRCLIATHETLIGLGEDQCACTVDSGGGLICVADGCGGIGSRRYEKLQNRTEASVAAQLAVETACRWAAELDGQHLPSDRAAAVAVAHTLEQALADGLKAFHHAHCNDAPSRVIMRGLQRTLPTTLCLTLIDARARDALSLLFLWAGDSRGYVWSADGLRQCTADHTTGHPDALENLYRDAKLTNMVNADVPFTMDVLGMHAQKPCIVIAATDGAFGYLPTPMEFELMLLDALRISTSFDRWQARLQRTLARIGSDDSTLVMACFGFENFAAIQAHFSKRMKMFKAAYVTPVRRRKQGLDPARSLWAEYRKTYELSQEVRDADWRL